MGGTVGRDRSKSKDTRRRTARGYGAGKTTRCSPRATASCGGGYGFAPTTALGVAACGGYGRISGCLKVGSEGGERVVSAARVPSLGRRTVSRHRDAESSGSREVPRVPVLDRRTRVRAWWDLARRICPSA